MRPLIGITCSRVVGGAWGLYSPGHMMDYTFDDYSQAICYSGGAPVLVPVAQNRETFQTILERLDGLLLSGGPDINPRFYGEEPLEGLGEIDEGLDQMELQIAKMAFKRNFPIFAICRGIQVLNVSLGGTLYQDIANQIKGSTNHTQKADITSSNLKKKSNRGKWKTSSGDQGGGTGADRQRSGQRRSD
jgi:putative glutamine amidotransferase